MTAMEWLVLLPGTTSVRLALARQADPTNAVPHSNTCYDRADRFSNHFYSTPIMYEKVWKSFSMPCTEFVLIAHRQLRNDSLKARQLVTRQ